MFSTAEKQGPQEKYTPGELESIQFDINLAIHGDVLLRCRHADFDTNSRVSLFRASFHTGFVQPPQFRLSLSQVDVGSEYEK